jgi:NTP pyrophosphatase (non-canonical NTP hydrolase)
MDKMITMDLDKLQEVVDKWINEHGGYWDKFQILARLTEELGEVASDLQRQEGLRPIRVETDLQSEVGDLLFTLAAFSNANGINLTEAIEKVIAKYDARDSKPWKEKFGTK